MRIHKKAITLTLLMCAIALAIAFVLLPHSAKAASTYTVDSIGDEPDDNPGDLACHTALDTCTLRAAIQEVNAGSGGDTINFGIAGSGVHTLTPASCYADITKSVTINGYSQPGSAVNTAVAPAALNGVLTIEIDGTNADDGGGGCHGLSVMANNTTIKGLVINRFIFNNNGKAGIRMNSVSNASILGNYIGTDTTGLIEVGASRQREGIHTEHCIDCIIGTTAAADRNIISGNSQGITLLDASNGTTIRGNYVGVGADGSTNLGNKDGAIGINGAVSSGMIIGGSASGSTNIISGAFDGGFGLAVNNGASTMTIEGNYIGLNATGNAIILNILCGLFLADVSDSTIINNVISGSGAFGGMVIIGNGGSSGNIIQGNKIGTDKDGNSFSGSGNGTGITIGWNSFDNLIGGTGVGEGNIIANSTAMGVNIQDLIGFGIASPINNTIIGNSIYGNGGIGIDLTGATAPFSPSDINVGVTPNDAGDPDDSSNHYINFPIINSATKGTGQVTVNYDLDINPAEVGATGYSVDFYANSTNAREGAIYLGSDVVPGDVTGQSATLTLPGSVPADYYVTAVTTMTDVSSDGYGHSSEFSAPIQAIAASPTPGPTPTPAPVGTSTDASSLANTGQPQHTNQRLFIALALIAAGVLGILGQRLYKKHKTK